MSTHPAMRWRFGARRLIAVLLATAASSVSLLVLSAPAQAATARNGVCESGEFCYYFNSGEQGSVSDFSGSVSDYGTTEPSCYDFKGAGNGKGQCIKNNAASAWNRASVPVTVYYNSGYGGHSQTFAAGAKGQLDSTLYNENASHSFGSSGGGSVTGSQAAARAQKWVDANVPYSQSNHYQGYREDCSGYVSMAWGLPTPGRTTDTMSGVGRYIAKSDLKEGDALLKPAAGSSGHMLMFVKWADSSHSHYYAYEESPGGGGAHYLSVPYPYFSGYGTFRPFRYNGLS